jgi:hypothetical protein
MSPAPTDVKVALGPKVVPLTPDTSEPGKFASIPDEYPDALRGKIELQKDGKPIEATFTFR